MPDLAVFRTVFCYLCVSGRKGCFLSGPLPTYCMQIMKHRLLSGWMSHAPPTASGVLIAHYSSVGANLDCVGPHALEGCFTGDTSIGHTWPCLFLEGLGSANVQDWAPGPDQLPCPESKTQLPSCVHGSPPPQLAPGWLPELEPQTTLSTPCCRVTWEGRGAQNNQLCALLQNKFI